MSTQPSGAVSRHRREGRSARDPGEMDRQAPARPMWRYRLARLVVNLATRTYSRVRIEGLEALPPGAAVVCFSHQNWADPLYLIAALPAQPRVHFFGPEQNDMTRGVRNRLMRWVGVAIPFHLGKRGMLSATRRAQELLEAGDRVAIAGEGRIHSGEDVVLPLLAGPAYLSLRSRVPLVPVTINGTGWLAFRRLVRIRIGTPIEPAQALGPDAIGHAVRPRQAAVAALTARTRQALLGLAADFGEPPPSRGLGGRLTELFNEWPEGSRPPSPPRDGGAGANT
jgi:1-acyl-sn-glycerol-3-phosphate acyltransferase